MCEAESKMIYIFFIKFYDAFKSDQMYGCLFRLDDSQKPITKYTPHIKTISYYRLINFTYEQINFL